MRIYLGGWVRGLLLAFLSVILMAPVAEAGFFQQGSNAARTGFSTETGPGREDVALNVSVPGMISDEGPPVILDGYVYFTTNYHKNHPETLNQNGLWRLNLSSGARPERLAYFDLPLFVQNETRFFRNGIASDGTRIFVADPKGLKAFAPTGGPPLWDWTPDTFRHPTDAMMCPAPAVRDGLVFVGCTWGQSAAQTPDGDTEHWSFLAAFDAVTGQKRWLWFIPSPVPPSESTIENAPNRGLTINQISAVGSLVLASTSPQLVTYPLQSGLWAVYANNGTLAWAQNQTLGDFATDVLVPKLTGTQPDWKDHAQAFASPPSGDGAHIYYKHLSLVEYEADTGVPTGWDWHEPTVADDLGSPLVVAGGSIYVSSPDDLVRLDGPNHKERWRLGAPPGETWGPEGLFLAGGTLFGRTDLWQAGVPNPSYPHSSRLTHSTIHAIDPRTGADLWTHTVHPRLAIAWHDYRTPYTIAASYGVLAVAGVDGSLMVLGRTPASIQPHLNVSTLYPALGATVRVDLGETAPGVQGPATRFGVQWDLDADPELQSSPVFSHQFNESRIVVARFIAENEAGQRSSEDVVFQVGGTPPVPVSGPVATAAVPLAEPTARPSTLDRFLAPENRGLAYVGLAGALLALLLLGLVMVWLIAAGRRPAKKVERYIVERELGRGSNGRTFLALDTILDRKVVLKQSTAPWLWEGESRDKFLQEARVLAKLQHPNVVGVHEILTKEKGPPTLVLEYVEGGSLEDRLRRGRRLPPADAVAIARDALDGLGHIHAAGIVHRDIKPANVLLTKDGRTKIADFGIARPLHQDMAATMGSDGLQAGSPLYMSPEQARAQPVDQRSDLYSLAAVLFEMLTGRHYLGARNQPEFRVREWIAEETPDLRAGGAPVGFLPILETALQKDRAKRFPTAAAMKRALEGVAAPRSRRPTPAASAGIRATSSVGRAPA